jgi:hypothetical protein
LLVSKLVLLWARIPGQNIIYTGIYIYKGIYDGVANPSCH